MGPLKRTIDALALSRDGQTIYVTEFTPGDTTSRDLVAFDVSLLRTRWRKSLFNAESRYSGMTVIGEYAIAVSADGQRLFLASCLSNGVRGIGVLDADAGTGLGLIGPLLVVPGGLLALAPSAAYPRGVLLALGRRTPYAQPGLDSLFIMDAQTLGTIDSIGFPGQAAAFQLSLRGLFSSASPGVVFVTAPGFLYRVDLLTRRAVATPVPGSGPVLATADGQTVYLLDHGTSLIDDPGAGIVREYDSTLVPRDSIDLRPAFGGTSPVMRSAVISQDDRLLYVLVGTASRGPLYGPQPAALIAIDRRARAPVSTTSLDEWNPLALVARRGGYSPR